jgi:hypothetical protein
MGDSSPIVSAARFSPHLRRVAGNHHRGARVARRRLAPQPDGQVARGVRTRRPSPSGPIPIPERSAVLGAKREPKRGDQRLKANHRTAASMHQTLLRYLAGLSVFAREGPSTGTLADVPTQLLTAVLARVGELGWERDDRALLFAVLAKDSRASVRRAVTAAQCAFEKPRNWSLTLKDLEDRPCRKRCGRSARASAPPHETSS